MYLIYESKALILESFGAREADKVFTLYTEEFGLIRARAQAVRKMESKLRPHLVDFSLIHVSLVRGKGSWRVVSARREKELPDFSDERGKAFVRATTLILRLVQGERKDQKLFSIICSAYSLLLENTVEPSAFEIGLVLKILHELGYVDPKDPFDGFLSNSEFSFETISHFAPFAHRAVAIVNASLRESQL